MRPLFLALLFAGACAAPRRFEQARVLMGTRARVALYAADETAARAHFEAAFARLEALDRALSDWRDDSELAALCAAPPGRPHAVGPDLYGALEGALRFATDTDGAFDPTVGPLSLLWREHRDAGTLPPEDARRLALERTGTRHVRLHPRDRAVTLAREGMRLDLGGIGKGYAADAVVSMLRTRGAPRCLVDLGGDVAIGDAPPDAAGWEIAVGDAPVLLLARRGVASSGDLERFLEVDGVRYSHVLDPRTGLGVTHGLRATVVAPTAAEADAIATALCAMDRPERLLFLRDRRDRRVFLEEPGPRLPEAGERPPMPWRETRDGEIASVEDGSIRLRLRGNVLPGRGTRFLVWRGGSPHADIAVLEVVAAGPDEVAARILEQEAGIELGGGMSVASPFFDGFGRPRVHVDGAVRGDRARLEGRIHAAGGRFVAGIEHGVDVVVVDDATAAVVEAIERRDALTRDAPDVVKQAIAAGAILVSESRMQRLLGD